MASNLFERHSREQGVFKNERYLWPEFVPERLPHRDAEINSIVYALNPVTKGGKMHNLFLHGPTGTGKTACIKYVLSQLEEFSDRAKTHYINCFEYGTRHAVLASIASFIGAVIPRRGTAADEVFTQMVEKLKTLNYAPIVILDEADQLEKSGEHSALLYDILRVIEYQKNRIGLVLISNDAGFTSRLDERVRSSLSAEVIEFVPYSPVQMKDILRERCEQAFSESVLESDVINLAAAFAAKNGGDARVAIEALWKAGREAQREGSNTVSLKHLRRAMDTINFSRAPKEMKNLN
jgi:cell division control protein 6